MVELSERKSLLNTYNVIKEAKSNRTDGDAIDEVNTRGMNRKSKIKTCDSGKKYDDNKSVRIYYIGKENSLTATKNMKFIN